VYRNEQGVKVLETRVLVRANSYYDSVSLMAVSQRVTALPGVLSAVVAMGTDMNKEMLDHVGLLTDAARSAGPTDLVIAVGAETIQAAEEALGEVNGILKQRSGAGQTGAAAVSPRTIRAAVKSSPESNLALISVPGAYAAREARIALEQGLHVMLYSDNVALEDEVDLKRFAHQQELLLMGPDCGTAIIGGVGLGFANAVRRGPIGVVAASGTGAQEISCLIDQLGSGVSHLIGVGGRDLSKEVGGVMMMDGIKLLNEDPGTTLIVLVSKPPAPEVIDRVLAFASSPGSKPFLTCFLGRAKDGSALPGIDQVAVAAVAQATGVDPSLLSERLKGQGQADQIPRPGSGRRYLRGLFSGGTLCDQALLQLEPALGPITCNIHPDPSRRGTGTGHSMVDLGDDQFTRGRPHPMIDMTLRRQRLLAEGADPQTAVVLLDVVLGFGAHPDPAGDLADSIRTVVAQGVLVVASVTGTEGDPQRHSAQIATLHAAGAHVAPTASQAATVVAKILGEVGST